MAAIKPSAAERFVAAPPEGIRLFLLYGNDAGAITERARRLERVALQRGGGEAVLRFGSDEISADPGRIPDEAYAASLFGGEPVIALRVLDGRHNVFGALRPLLERPPDAAWLVVEAGELKQSSPLRKAFEALPKAAAVPTYGLEGDDVARFIAAAAEAADLTVEPPALELLAESLAGDRLATRGELEKLFLYVKGSSRVGVADVQAIVGETVEARADEVIDAALLGGNEAVERGLTRMLAEGGSAAALGTLALRHLMQVQAMRTALDEGATMQAALARARPPVFSRRRRSVEAAVGRWTIDALVEARRTIDRAIALSRLRPGLEDAAISEALHRIALTARRLKRGAR